MTIHFDVKLGAAAAGYPILSTDCRPAPEDTAHRAMCAYQAEAAGFMRAMAKPPAMLGKRLEESLSWKPETNRAACLCSDANRNHKWRMVFQTIHYALNGGGRGTKMEGAAP